MKQPSYKIYPSLLDKFDKYLRADEEVENFWNIDNETGEYKRSPEEIEESLKQDLLDAINRVPFESEAADKGTAFNAIIDCYVHCENHVPTERSPYSIIGDKETNTIQVAFPATDIAPARHFLFDRQWCIEQAEYFKGSLSQVYVSAILPTQYGNVELYGFIDELRKDVVYDIKSTSKYEFGKYAHGWQRHVYPYCLIASGQMENIKAFEFTAYALKGGTSRTPLISGTQYPEYYTYKNKAKGLNKTENPGDSAFQVYGYYQGLKAAEIGNDKYSEETEGGWNISLQETKVPKSALFLYKTSYDATKTLVETLTKPAE